MPELDTKRVCTTCNKLLDLKYFSFRTDTGKYRSQCKSCHKGYNIDLFDKQEYQMKLISEGCKECTKCKKVFSLDNFGIDRNTRYGYTGRCKSCLLEIRSENGKWGSKKHRYGITKKEYEIMNLSQKGKCAICKTKDTYAVDHCHSTGVVRGLLCRECNLGLGMFQDNTEFLNSAIKYLQP